MVILCPDCSGADPYCSCAKSRGKVQIYECPMRLLPQDSASLVQDWQLLQIGILPATGGWDDQVASWCEVMVTLGSEFTAISVEQADEERQDAKREAGRRARRH